MTAQQKAEEARREAHATCGKCDGDPNARGESDYAIDCNPHHAAIDRYGLLARLAARIDEHQIGCRFDPERCVRHQELRRELERIDG